VRAHHQRFFARSTPGCRLLITALLVLLAAMCARSADAAGDAGKTSHRGLELQQHRRAQSRSWRAATAFARPRFYPTRTIKVDDVSAFWRAWRGIRPGDEIDVRGVRFPGEAVFKKQLPDWAEVHFQAGTSFSGRPGANLPAAWISGSSHIRFYGGRLTNPSGGSGITIQDSSYVTWRNFVISRTGGTGLMVQGIEATDTHLDLKGAISHWGLNLALDPHAVKGTGLHGALLADSRRGVADSRFALDLHDGAVGSGAELGGAGASDGFWRNTLYLRCRNLTMVAGRWAAGNCAQLWGQNVIGNDFRYLEAENLTGRPYNAGGMDPHQSLATNRVVYGRASHTNLNSALGPIRWDRQFGTVFENVSPSP
jgi:hypothetical protein